MKRRFFLSVMAAAGPFVFVQKCTLLGAGYWGIQLTLTTSAQNVLTLLRAVDTTIPQKPSRVDVQFDPSQFDPNNPYSKVVSVGDASLSSSRKAYGLLPGGTSSYLAPTDLNNIYALGNTNGLLFNVQVQA